MDKIETRIRVLVVEADSLLRDMLRAVLSTEQRLRIVGSTGDPSEAVRLARAEQPDVMLVGLDAESEHDALALAQSISSSKSGPRVVFLGERPDHRTLAALPAFRAAGWSYLLRQSVSDVATLVRAIEGDRFQCRIAQTFAHRLCHRSDGSVQAGVSGSYVLLAQARHRLGR